MADRNVKLLLQIISQFDPKGARQAQQDTDKVSKTLGNLSQIASGAVLSAGTAIATFAVRATNEFQSFERGMNEVFTLLPNISDQAMSQMQDQVRAAAVEMKRLPEDVVPALYQSLSAGVPPDNVFQFLETANKAAVGGVTDLETAVDGLSSVVNAYGSDVIGAGEASDLMFTAVRLGKTTFDELSGSLFNVVPVASSLGVEFSNVTAALAAMTAQGVPTSVATTQLRQLLIELSKEGGKTASLFEELSGRSFRQFIAEGGNVQQALQLMEAHATSTNVGVNDLFGSVEAGNAALALTGQGAQTFTADLEAMEASLGSTEQAFDRMNQGGAVAMDELRAAAADLRLEIGEQLSPAADEAATRMAGLARASTNVLRATQESEKSGLQKFLITLNEINKSFGGLPADKFVQSIGGVERISSTAAIEVAGTADSLDDLRAKLEAAGAVAVQTINPVTGLEQTIFRLGDGVSFTGEKLLELAATQGTVRTGLELTNAEMGAWLARMEQAMDVTDAFVEDQRELTEITEEERDAMVAAGQAADDFANAQFPAGEASFRVAMNAQLAAVESENLAEKMRLAEEQAQRNREAFELLGGRISGVQGPIAELIAAQEELANTSGAAAEEAQARVIAANEAIAESYRQVALDILKANLAEAYGEDALGAQLAAIQQAEALGLISEAQATLEAETAVKMQRTQDVVSQMTQAFLADGQLTREESEQIANAVGLIEAGAESSDEAIRILAQHGVAGFGEMGTAAGEALGAFDEMGGGAERLGDKLSGIEGDFESTTGEAIALGEELQRRADEIQRFPERVTVRFESDTSQWNPPNVPGGGPVNSSGPAIAVAEGGQIRGGIPGRDSVPAWLMPGEIVIPTRHTRTMADVMRFASRYVPLDGMRRFAHGGMVSERTVTVPFVGGGDTFQIYTMDRTDEVVDQMQRRQRERRWMRLE